MEKRIVHIDLADLTPKIVKQSIPHINKCDYRTCIVGRLMSKEDREYIVGSNYKNQTINDLFKNGIVKAPRGQKKALVDLQKAFDHAPLVFDGIEKLLELTDKLMAKYSKAKK